MIQSLRDRSPLLPSTDTLDRLGLAARSAVGRWAYAALLGGISDEQLKVYDQLLIVVPAIGQTRFEWLRETAVEGSSAFGPFDEHLIPQPAFEKNQE